MANVLRKKTVFKHFKSFFAKMELNYLYIPSKGIYSELNYNELVVVINDILKEFDLPITIVEYIVKSLRLGVNGSVPPNMITPTLYLPMGS